MSNSKIMMVILMSLVCALGLSAQVSVSIHFFDKRLYVPGGEVPIKITLKNDTPSVYRFKLADERRRSLAFDVRTLSNRTLEVSDAWKRAMSSTTPAYYRELALEAGEEYSFMEDLSDHVAVSEAGTYMVSCTFYPELISREPSQATMASNVLTLSVRPGVPSPGAAESFRAGTAEVLKAEQVSPDEVIIRTINARQKARWNEFFLYIDIESLLRRNADKRRSYDRESDEGRRRMIQAFKTDLMAGVVDSDIVTIPSSFEILETRYGGSRGTVQVTQKFDYQDFRMVKLYIYELEKRDDVWYIISYTVMNKGTE